MNFRELGETGIRLPEIGLGTWEYTGGIDPMRKAIDLGAFLIDTAEIYETEDVVGEAIRGIRDRVFVATKVSPGHFRRGDLLAAADKSLQRLKIDYIDLYQLHWPNPAVPIGETIAAMEELVNRGKVRFIGVSNFSIKELGSAQAALAKDKIVSNQLPYSLADRRIEAGLLSYCQKSRTTVIAYNPLARGLQNIRARDRRDILGKVAAAIGKTEAQVALNWCISREGVIVIPKTNSVTHVVENCNASGWRLSKDQIKLLDETFPRRVWLQTALRDGTHRILRSLNYRES